MNGVSPVLQIQNLAVSFPTSKGDLRAVSEVELSIHAGSMLALVGESGSGKSLTALAVMGLLPKPGRVAQGSISLDGRNLATLSEEEMRSLRGTAIGMVFQEPMTSLNPVYTIGFHLKEAIGGASGRGGDELKRRSVELLREVGIPEPEARLKSYPHELSGGMRQRVMIACAMARNPRLLIADEPTTALDVTVEAQIMSLIRRLKEARGAAVLLVTHDLGLVAQHADSVAVVYAGYVVEIAPVAEFFAKPLHPYAKALLNALPRMGDGERLTPIPGTVPDPAHLPAGCPFLGRCQVELPACADAVPGLRDLGGGRKARCVRVAADA